MDVKKRVHEVLETAAPADRLSRGFGVFLMSVIFLNVVAFALETVPAVGKTYASWFWGFEVFSIAVFTVEYALRLWSCTAGEKFPHPVLGRLRFMATPFALIDLMAILPFYLPSC